MNIREWIAAGMIAVSCAASCNVLAMTIAVDDTRSALADGAVRTGSVDAIGPGYSITIDGTTYIFSAALARLHDETGKVVAGLNLEKGMPVSFATKADGSRLRITELWVRTK